MKFFNYNSNNTAWYIYIDYEKRTPYYIDSSGVNIIVCRDYKHVLDSFLVASHATGRTFVADIPVNTLGVRVVSCLRDLEQLRPYLVRIHIDPVGVVEKRKSIKNIIDILESYNYKVEVYNSYNGEPITI